MLKKFIMLSLLILFAVTSAATAAPVQEQSFKERTANLAEFHAIRVGYGRGTVRIVLDLTREVQFTESYVENPSRMIVDLQDTWLNPKVQREIELKSTVGKRIRIAQFNPTTVRIVIESMAGTKLFFLPGGQSGCRLIIDLGNTDFKEDPELNKSEAERQREIQAQQQREREAQAQREQELREQQERELQQQREQEFNDQRERELRERELELERRERELKEKEERELREKRERELDKRERELQEKERELQERERERLEKEHREKEKRERELKEKKEKERLEREIKEQREREKQLKEQEKREKKERERLEKEKREKEKLDKKNKDKDKDKEQEKKEETEQPFTELDNDLNMMTALKGKKIVIDPGHGGNDAGAIGPTGVMEKNVTLRVALELKRLLEAEGAQIIMTRYDDSTVSPKGAKASDIEELGARCDVANRNKADIFISIHADSFTRPEARGTTGYYYSKGSGAGQKLADCIRRNLVEQLGTPSRGTQPCNFYVVKNTDMPATLIELGFISNKEEEKLLDSEDGVKRAAQGILDGIEDYFG